MKYKSPAFNAAITGIVLAGSVLAYGLYQDMNSIPDLSVNENLPAPHGTLPPPSTFFMGTEPPTDVPGIRRLKVMRPVIQSDDGTTISTQELYLTGTKSAELIREPVEANIRNFPTVSLDEALEGALANDEWGFQIVQAYINQALGDETRVKNRTKALLDALEGMAGEVEIDVIADAANQIIEAAARTHWAAFMSPMVLDPGFELTEGAIGWDFGPSDVEPFEGFERVSSESDMIVGEQANNTWQPEGSSILSQGVNNIEEFVASGLEDGLYRVVILTAPRPDGSEPLYPFGVDLNQNGAKMNLVDTRATDDLSPVMSLATNGPGRLGDSAPAASISNQNAPPQGGVMLVTRVEVTDGTLRLDFKQLGGQNTYVTSVIIYPELPTDIIEEIRLEVAELISAVTPAAGPAPTSIDQILPNPLAIIDPETAFQDNGGGLPTAEAEISTPTPDTSTPTPTPGTNNPVATPPPVPGIENPQTPDPVVYSVVANAGAYDPVLLGEDFTVDGCASTFSGESACNLTDTGAFELVWLLDGEEIGTGETLVIETGEGSLFAEEGTYDVTLEIRYDGSLVGEGITVTLADGSTLFLPGDILLTSVGTAVITVIAPVPEPESVFLLAPGLALIAARQARRRRRKQKA